ncbi:hypothetical protein FQN57_004855 [Myotisia sp. PD_48]|nr:hypothetical protein FQN57_004855 [Myotisia sp. PD_48]
MGSFGAFLLVYVLGGLTLIPLLACLFFLHAYLSLPVAPESTDSQKDRILGIARKSDDEYSLRTGTDQLADKFQRSHESDVAAGYFAVCRDYVPGGVNGKPPERTTPAGEVIATESPSVYQSVYRSIFDRKQAPTLDPTKGNPRSTRKGRNVFFIVLRHGHLMLYDDAEQIEVRYVISLTHHDVSVYGGGDQIPEGELWIKRNAICLSRKPVNSTQLNSPPPTLPFYLFSENLSEKEDFYFAILNNLDKIPDSSDSPPTPQHFDVKNIITLVQRLHSSEEQLQTRWFNAMIGRLFLALYQTPELEGFIRNKIAKKISRVKKPNFITRIQLRKISAGDGAPFITNPRLKDLTVDGDCCVEANINYSGNFRVEIAATARIELGTRFKPREVDLVLAVVLNKLNGHCLFRFKPPPSNRLWISFETMPTLEMTIEPIVSSRQITYGIILRAIESRIREVIAETLVQPFWDDIPFLETTGEKFRGGIWEKERKPETPTTAQDSSLEDTAADSLPEILKDPAKEDEDESDERANGPTQQTLYEAYDTAASNKQTVESSSIKKSGTSSNASNSRPSSAAGKEEIESIRITPVDEGRPYEESLPVPNGVSRRSTRSSSFSPVVGAASSFPPDPSVTREEGPRDDDATNRSRAQSAESSSIHTTGSRHDRSNSVTNILKTAKSRSGSATSTSSGSLEPRQAALLSFGSAAAAAKKWGLNVLNRNDQASKTDGRSNVPDHPVGRGRPLPPPGTPLPSPGRFTFNPVSLPKRKAVPPPLLPERNLQPDPVKSSPIPPLPQRPSTAKLDEISPNEELLVIKAPPASEPGSPRCNDNHGSSTEEDDSVPEEWSNQILLDMHDNILSAADDSMSHSHNPNGTNKIDILAKPDSLVADG